MCTYQTVVQNLIRTFYSAEPTHFMIERFSAPSVNDRFVNKILGKKEVKKEGK